MGSALLLGDGHSPRERTPQAELFADLRRQDHAVVPETNAAIGVEIGGCQPITDKHAVLLILLVVGNLRDGKEVIHHLGCIMVGVAIDKDHLVDVRKGVQGVMGVA